jgi:hypothetical protein
MKDIFSGAERVLSWLGPAADDSDELVDLIGTGRYPTYSAIHDVRLQKSYVSNIANADWFMEKTREAQRFLEFLDYRRGAIEALFSRPYWQRIWIVQEVRYAQKHFVLCGEKVIDFADLNVLVTNMKYRREQGRRIGSDATAELPKWRFPPYSHAYSVLNPPMALTEFSLSNVISTYRQSLCTDVRDRVYEVMSLVNERVTIPVDYGKSAFELYFITLAKIIQTEWGHENKVTEKYTDELRKTLGLGIEVDTTFVRLFVQCGIKYRPRLLRNGLRL